MSRPCILLAVVLSACGLAVALAAVPVRAGTTITVNSTFDVLDPNDGQCTLREAIIAANTDEASGGVAGECPAGSGADTIMLPPGTFRLTIAPTGNDDALTGDLNITSSVTIRGAGDGATIIDASAINDRALLVYGAAQFTLSSLRIQNGRRLIPDGNGGGIWLLYVAQANLSQLSVMSSTALFGGGIDALVVGQPGLVMTNVLLSHNSAVGSGGGFDNDQFSVAALTNVTLTDNQAAGSGGGIQSYYDTLMSLNGVLVDNNQAAQGAGILNLGGLVVTNSVVVGNVLSGTSGVGGGIGNFLTLTLNSVVVMSNTAASGAEGGGIFNGFDGLARLDRVTLSANAAITGGSIFNEGKARLTNVTLSGNSGGNCAGTFHLGPGLGSAIYQLTGTLTLNNVTVAGNCTQNVLIGAAVQVVNGSAQAKNSLFDQSGGHTCNGVVTSLGHNLDRLSQCNFHQTGDLNGVNPLLGPLADNGGPLLTHALLPNSPAIDAADNVDCPAFDERGYKRPADGNRDGLAVCDMGAYEFWPSLFLPLIVR